MVKKIDPAQKVLLEQIRTDIKGFFDRQNIPVRVIYRTCQSKFRGEGPHNLIPTKLNPSRVTIFLDFEDRISTACLERVYAFKESDSEDMPKFLGRFQTIKVDLDKLPGKYIFRDIDDLKKNYRRLLF